MIIVGLTGSIGSGKTTFAQFVAERAGKHAHFESWELVAEVANSLRASNDFSPVSSDTIAVNKWLEPLPGIIEQICHKKATLQQIALAEHKLTDSPDSFVKLFEYLDNMTNRPELLAQVITEENKETFRNILQWLGGYLVKTVGAGVWYDEIVRRIQAQPKLDLATVGGVRFPGDARRISQAGGKIILITRPSIEVQDAGEVTERERGLIEPDTTVINNSSLANLESCAHAVWTDLKAGKLASEYSASNKA